MRKLFYILVMMLLMPMLAWADDSGSCGANVNYTYTESTKTLVISGTGEMDDYTSYSLYSTTAPWNSYKDIIQTVIIENGVTHVGGYAFCLCYALTSVTLPNSVTSIGKDAFQRKRVELAEQETRLKEQIAVLEKQAQELKMEGSGETARAVEKIQSFSGAEALSADVVKALVKEVRITDREHMEIRWNFKDEVMEFIES